MQRTAGLIAAAAVAIGAAVWAQTNRPAPIAAGDWVNINREPGATRFSPLTQINPGNVATLTQAWTLPMGGGGSSVPLVVDGVMYVSSGRCVVAIDGDTGKEVWAYIIEAAAPPAGAGAPPAPAPPATPVSAAPPVTPVQVTLVGATPPVPVCAHHIPPAPPGGAGRAGGGPGGGGGGGRGGPPSASQRGLSYWPGDGTNAPRIMFMAGNRLMAVDAKTG